MGYQLKFPAPGAGLPPPTWLVFPKASAQLPSNGAARSKISSSPSGSMAEFKKVVVSCAQIKGTGGSVNIGVEFSYPKGGI